MLIHWKLVGVVMLLFLLPEWHGMIDMMIMIM
jgi:hypothetical protein